MNDTADITSPTELTAAYDAAERAGLGWREGTAFYAHDGEEDTAAAFLTAWLDQPNIDRR